MQNSQRDQGLLADEDRSPQRSALIRDQLARILSSPGFVNSARMCQFLRFVVENSLSYKDCLKETVIGVEVFSRAPGYDPGTDPIVRVEARRLRDKLARYYAREDADDVVVIKLPKGGYTPEFEILRNPRKTVAAHVESRTTPPTGCALGAPPKERRSFFPDWWGAAAPFALRLAPRLEDACEGGATRYSGPALLVRAVRPRPASHRLLYALGVAAVFIGLIFSGLILATQTKPTIASDSQSRFRITPEAREAYLKGRYFWNKRTESGFFKSLGYFQEAVAKSPKYARAWAGLADSYLLLGEFRFLPREQAFVKAQTAIDKALVLDNNLGEAHATLAALEADNNKWGLAEPEFRRALQLSPEYATAHQWYAEELVAHGRTSDALAEIRRANKLDPLSLTVSVQVGYILFMARRYDEAIAQLQSAIDMDPHFGLAHAVLGHAYEQKGMYAEAISELKKSADLSQDPAQTLWLAHARALAGQKAEARRVRAALEESGHAPALPMALLDLALGERNHALARLEGACSNSPLGALSPTPLYDPFRVDPQIAALLAGCATQQYTASAGG